MSTTCLQRQRDYNLLVAFQDEGFRAKKTASGCMGSGEDAVILNSNPREVVVDAVSREEFGVQVFDNNDKQKNGDEDEDIK